MPDEIGSLIGEAIAACGRDPATLVEWRSLTGSSSKQTYLVETKTETLVVRFHAPSGEPVLALAREHDLLAAVAAAGLGPAVVGMDAAHAALVQCFVEAEPWTKVSARRPGNIVRAAMLLKRLHALKAVCRPFCPAHDAALYCARARRHGRFDDRDRALADELESLAVELTRQAEPPVLCHNDLVAANILDNGELLLIDFEYAVNAPAIVDLASLAAMNDFDAAERALLLNAYYGSEAAGPGPEALESAVRLHRLLAYFWALGADSEQAFAKRSSYADRDKLSRG